MSPERIARTSATVVTGFVESLVVVFSHHGCGGAGRCRGRVAPGVWRAAGVWRGWVPSADPCPFACTRLFDVPDAGLVGAHVMRIIRECPDFWFTVVAHAHS